MTNDIFLALGVSLTFLDYFDLIHRAEHYVDVARIRSAAISARIRPYILICAIIAIGIALAIILADEAYRYAFEAENSPHVSILYSDSLLVQATLYALVFFSAGFGIALVLSPLLWLLSLFLRLLDWPPKGTLATIGLFLAAREVFLRFFG